jgi:DNA-binding PadR family transcriptional regulator
MRKEDILNAAWLYKLCVKAQDAGVLERTKRYEYSVFRTAVEKGFLVKLSRNTYQVTDLGKEFIKVRDVLSADLQARKDAAASIKAKQMEALQRRAQLLDEFEEWRDYESPSKERRIRAKYIPS